MFRDKHGRNDGCNTRSQDEKRTAQQCFGAIKQKILPHVPVTLGQKRGIKGRLVVIRMVPGGRCDKTFDHPVDKRKTDKLRKLKHALFCERKKVPWRPGLHLQGEKSRADSVIKNEQGVKIEAQDKQNDSDTPPPQCRYSNTSSMHPPGRPKRGDRHGVHKKNAFAHHFIGRANDKYYCDSACSPNTQPRSRLHGFEHEDCRCDPSCEGKKFDRDFRPPEQAQEPPVKVVRRSPEFACVRQEQIKPSAINQFLGKPPTIPDFVIRQEQQTVGGKSRTDNEKKNYPLLSVLLSSPGVSHITGSCGDTVQKLPTDQPWPRRRRKR